MTCQVVALPCRRHTRPPSPWQPLTTVKMSTHQKDINDSSSSETRHQRHQVPPPARVTQSPRADDAAAQRNTEARRGGSRQSRHNANPNATNIAYSNNNNLSNANPNILRSYRAQRNQNQPPPARIHFNTSDTSTWTPEMHRQYRIIQTPLTLEERIWDRRALLPSGFYNTTTSSSYQLSTTEQQRLHRPHHAAASNVPALSGIGAWAEQQQQQQRYEDKGTGDDG